MYKIVETHFLAEDIKLFKIDAPKIAVKRKAGQFVIIRIDEEIIGCINVKKVIFIMRFRNEEKT